MDTAGAVDFSDLVSAFDSIQPTVLSPNTDLSNIFCVKIFGKMLIGLLQFGPKIFFYSIDRFLVEMNFLLKFGLIEILTFVKIGRIEIF